MKQNIQKVSCIYKLVFKSKDILCQWRQFLQMNASNFRFLVQCNLSWLGIWIRTQKLKACFNYRMSSNWSQIPSKTWTKIWDCRLVVWYKDCTRLPVSPSYWKYISQLWDLSKQVPPQARLFEYSVISWWLCYERPQNYEECRLSGESITGGGLQVLKPDHFLFSLPASPTTMDSISLDL